MWHYCILGNLKEINKQNNTHNWKWMAECNHCIIIIHTKRQFQDIQIMINMCIKFIQMIGAVVINELSTTITTQINCFLLGLMNDEQW